MVGEARLERFESGVAPATGGWFVVNVRDAAWLANEAFGARCVFETDRRVLGGRADPEPQRFDQLGITLAVTSPGRPSGLTADRSIWYPRSDLARRLGAGAEVETTSPTEAYAPFPHWRPGRYDWNPFHG
jgi:hypothetical protein